MGLSAGSQLFRGMKPIFLRRPLGTTSRLPEFVGQSGYLGMAEQGDAMLVRSLLMHFLRVPKSFQ